MTTKDDGGPAFPMSSVDGYEQTGMTLRQWFAGQALAGICVNDEYWRLNEEYRGKSASELAHRAYQVADAMIAEGSNKDGAE